MANNPNTEKSKIIIASVCFLLVYSTSILFLILNGFEAWTIRFFNALLVDPVGLFISFIFKLILIFVLYKVCCSIAIHRDWKSEFIKSQNEEEEAKKFEKQLDESDFIKFHSFKIKKYYNHASFPDLKGERVREIVDEYSTSFRVDMDEESASEIVNELMGNEKEII